MSYLYLIRHGQAGTRHDYDTLSGTGREQARLLGEFFAGQGVRFDCAFTGGMRRQRETGLQVTEAYGRAGLAFPEIVEHDAWREFDLDHVYRGLAPQLSAADPQFRVEYEAMRAQAQAERDNPAAGVHRRWSPCDIQIVDAWIHGRFPYDGESWQQFHARVNTAKIPVDAEGNIAVFTSATPAAVWAGRGLDLDDARILRIAGVLYNSSVTVIRLRGEQVRLFSLNGIPHLTDPALRTHR